MWIDHAGGQQSQMSRMQSFPCFRSRAESSAGLFARVAGSFWASGARRRDILGRLLSIFALLRPLAYSRRERERSCPALGTRKKLLTLLNVDSTGSATWFLDACGRTSHRSRRLLLSNHDLGVPLTSHILQPGLNFRASLPELFAGREMGEDVLRVLEKYLKALGAVHREVINELPQLRAALKRGRSLNRKAAPALL